MQEKSVEIQTEDCLALAEVDSVQTGRRLLRMPLSFTQRYRRRDGNSRLVGASAIELVWDELSFELYNTR